MLGGNRKQSERKRIWAREFSLNKSSGWVEVVVVDWSEGGVGGKENYDRGAQGWEMKGRGKGEQVRGSSLGF